MINSIVERNRFSSPITNTEKNILKTAIRLFLENGYSATTLKMISSECGLRQGTIAYHFHTKEDMLYYLLQVLTEFHGGIIDNVLEESNDTLFSYAAEIAIQIALCETDRKAWDLYYSAYSQFKTFEFIKKWGQDLSKDNSLPVLNGTRVYKYTDSYSNELKFGFADYTADGAVFNIPTAGTYSLVFADYESGRLNDIDIVPVNVTADEVGEITKIRENDITADTGDKIMLFADMLSLSPLCGEYIVK